jgi:hypothetical protein
MNEIKTFASLNDAIIAGYRLASTRIVTVQVGKIINDNADFQTVIFNELLTGKQIAISLNQAQANYLQDTFTKEVLYQISISDNTDKTVYAVYEKVDGTNVLKEYRTFTRACVTVSSIVTKDNTLVKESLLKSMNNAALKESTARDLYGKPFDELTNEEKKDIIKLLFSK